MRTPLPRDQHGAVLAGVKATPFGWPPASPDPNSGRRPTARPGAGSNKFRSLRFQGIAERQRQPRVGGGTSTARGSREGRVSAAGAAGRCGPVLGSGGGMLAVVLILADVACLAGAFTFDSWGRRQRAAGRDSFMTAGLPRPCALE
jgi:hypothetical protein